MSLFLRVADAIGEDGAIALFKAFAGGRVYIPDTIKPNHRLAALLSFEVAERLCFMFGCQNLEIPTGNHKGKKLLPIERYLVGELRSKGWSISRIAKQLKVTRRSIYSRLSKRKTFTLETPRHSWDDAWQLSLFD